MKSPRFLAALLAGKLCATFCKTFFPARGSNLPGEIALRLDPLFLRHVTGLSPSRTIFITGTNGKSTANNLIVHAFKTAGHSTASNLEGANMKPGAATALLKNTTLNGRFAREYLILEVDERSLALIAKELPPGQLCITNIQKDQVQRNGDPDYIFQKLKTVICARSENAHAQDALTLYVNNEEPRSKALGQLLRPDCAKPGEAAKTRVVSFGVAKNVRGTQPEPDFGVTMPCPLCHDALSFTHFNLAGVGFFECPACGFRASDAPDHQIRSADYENASFTLAGKEDRYHLAYPAAFFLYNYALCAAVCFENGIPEPVLAHAFDTFTNIGGRMETFAYHGKTVRYMRIKQENPETLQSALDTIAEDQTEKIFLFGPAVVDDIIPHYSNTFYTFDCNFEPFVKSGIERCICFGHTISYDAANRLRYAGLPDEKIEILDTDDDRKILAALADCHAGNAYLITWIKKYEKLKEYAK